MRFERPTKFLPTEAENISKTKERPIPNNRRNQAVDNDDFISDKLNENKQDVTVTNDRIEQITHQKLHHS